MSMPGSFTSGAGSRRRRAASEDEILLPVSPDEGVSRMMQDADGAIDEEDEDDDEDDEEYLDGGDLEDDNEEEDDEIAYMNEEDIEIELEDDEGFFDDDEDEDEDETDGDDMDPAMAEAERLASAAGVTDELADEQQNRPQRYTLAIDPATNSVYIVDSQGTRQNILSAAFGGEDENAGGGTPTGGLTAGATLAALRRMITRSRPAPRPVVAEEVEDDDEEEDARLFRFGYGGGRRSADGLFPKVTEPVQAGVDLERRGLFGTPGIKYRSYPRQRFSQRYQNINDTLRTREYCTAARRPPRAHLMDNVVPNSPGTEVARYDENVYCGQYSQDGTFFYTCAQDYKIRIYDMTRASKDKSVTDPTQAAESQPYTGRRWRGHRALNSIDRTSLATSKTVQAREHLSSWTITDANLSPDNSKMIWSTIGPVVGMTRFKDSSQDEFESLDDGDGQISLDFGAGRYGGRRHFGIWSVRFSADGREIVAGAQSGGIHVYDLDTRQTILSIQAHHDDVNAVCFADTASSNVLVSGSDDNYLKVWDRRSLGESGRFTKPSGVLVGHTEGITFVAPKGDGRFVISNAKDQTCKLWDLRKMYSADAFSELDRIDVSVRGFDYRYGLYRKPRFAQHPHDCSLMTYTGHTVLRTLIRCHFSPEATTGQRYIYSGSYDGKIHIWNLDGTVAQVLDRSKSMPLLTRGATSNQIKMNDPSQPDRPIGTYPVTDNSPVVRDISWAPYAPTIISSAWTEQGGSVAMHEWKGYGKRQ